MADVKAMTNAKQALRDLISKVGRDVAANAGASDGQLTFGEDGLGGEQSYHHAAIPVPDACAPGGLRTVATDLMKKLDSTQETIVQNLKG
jgi:hypothetical protein